MNGYFRNGLVLGIILLFLGTSILPNINGNKENKIEKNVILTSIIFTKNSINNLIYPTEINIEIYEVKTKDKSSITLIRYIGIKSPPIVLIHGMGGNHLIFDWDNNHSLARYLNKDGWDVWMLDLRTHDGDGDFFFAKESDVEYINRYWDFDRTLLKIDVVTAIEFVKNKTKVNKIFLSGHSYGGYLAYAYAELIGEENISGIITTGAAPYANPESFQPRCFEMCIYGFYFGNKAFVNPFGKPRTHIPKIICDYYYKNWKPTENHCFYYETTPDYIQKELFFRGDSEPAGVYVDMNFGKNPVKYGGNWVDPQTLYDYSENLSKIHVPILFIAGDNDTQDPSVNIYRAYENVSSEIKEFHNFSKHSHLDLLLGDDASNLIFPVIKDWLNLRISN